MTASAHDEHAVSAHAHPSPTKYLKIATILFVLTMIEVGVFYIEAIGPLMPYVLIALAASKFVLVGMYYMHLKFDGKLMVTLFVGPLAIAASLLFVLMALFFQFGPKLVQVASGSHG